MIVRIARNRSKKHMAAIILIVYALILLTKMILNTRLWHYGFVLAMPAMMVLVIALFDWAPVAIIGKGGRKGIFLASATTFIILFLLWHIPESFDKYQSKSVAIGDGKNLIITDSRGEKVKETIAWIKTNTSKNDTIAVLPEGAMINYFAERINPTPFINLMPPEILMFGEKRILEAFKLTAPDYILGLGSVS